MAKLTHLLWYQPHIQMWNPLVLKGPQAQDGADHEANLYASKQVFAVGDVTMVCPSLFTVNDSDFWVELSYMSRSAQGFFPLGSLSVALSLLP